MKKIGRIKRTFRKIKRRFTPGALILMYHRIADVPVDPRGTAVAPSRFAQHMEYIHQTCHPIRLLELVDAVQKRAVPHRAVAITFDDGYANNLIHAYPLLKANQIPATMFSIAANIDANNGFEWDILDQILLQVDPLPEHLHICLQGREYDWSTASLIQRQQAYQSIRHLFRSMTSRERTHTITDLLDWAGLKQAEIPTCRSLTADELLQLAQDELFDLGAHTLTHPILSTLSIDDQRTEILGSRQRLEAIAQSPVCTFSYPYGQLGDFTDETVKIVQSAGFRAACTTIQGVVEAGNDLFRLQRCEIQNWDIETFKKNLEWFFAS